MPAVHSKLNMLVQTPTEQKHNTISMFQSINKLKDNFSHKHNPYSHLSTANQGRCTIISLQHFHPFPLQQSSLLNPNPCWISSGSIDEKVKHEHNESACRKENNHLLRFRCNTTQPNNTAKKSTKFVFCSLLLLVFKSFFWSQFTTVKWFKFKVEEILPAAAPASSTLVVNPA